MIGADGEENTENILDDKYRLKVNGKYLKSRGISVIRPSKFDYNDSRYYIIHFPSKIEYSITEEPTWHIAIYKHELKTNLEYYVV